MANRRDQQAEQYNTLDVNDYLQSYTKKLGKLQIGNSILQEQMQDFSIEDVVAEIETLLPKKTNKRSKQVSQDLKRKNILMAIRLLENNINTCFYGLYSCYQVLEDLVDEAFPESIQIKIQGYNSNVYIHHVLIKILQAIEIFGELETYEEIQSILTARKPKVQEITGLIQTLLTKMGTYKELLVIVFHNIDGKNFRELETHNYLSEIAAHPQVRFIASLNNCYFPNFLSKKVATNYRFVYLKTEEKRPFNRELVYDEISLLNKREMKGAESLKMVFQSLTELQKNILILLAQTLLESPTNSIEYYKFYEICVEEMLVAGESQLKENLAEAQDHKILIDKVGDKSKRLITMPFSTEVLRELAETETF